MEPRPRSSMPGRKARIVRCMDLTLRSKEKSQSASEQSSTRAVVDEAGAVEQDVDRRRSSRGQRVDGLGRADVEGAEFGAVEARRAWRDRGRWRSPGRPRRGRPPPSRARCPVRPPSPAPSCPPNVPPSLASPSLRRRHWQPRVGGRRGGLSKPTAAAIPVPRRAPHPPAPCAPPRSLPHRPPGGWRGTFHPPIGSDPEGSSPNGTERVFVQPPTSRP